MFPRRYAAVSGPSATPWELEMFFQAPLPESMRAVIVKEKVGRFDETCKPCFDVQEVPIPKAKNGEVLVRIARAQINPSDTSFFKGVYGQKLEIPSRAGFEGCGVVVESAGDAIPFGTRVAFRSFGTWAEYCTAPVSQCIALTPETEWSNAAGALVNPLTVFSMIEIAKRRQVKTIALTAAASGLGRQLIRYAKACGIESIAVVRRPEQMEICIAEGARVALDSTSPTFEEDLQAACKDGDCRIGFDAVAGPVGAQVLHSLSTGGTLYVYGGLSGKPISDVAWSHLIFQRKSVEGFWMTATVKELASTETGAAELRGRLDAVGNLLQSQLRTCVSRTFPLTEVGDALVFLRKNMSAGKVQLIVGDP
eukprot:CAMPEP_0198206994 /NCGR_PEP_ID=MMETSP1445-20131203/10499_1 /TAXON_ID=36898 /ORGANISM="Pyramimonas sp., Strain CCMP2087" /LENGTH=365 /DNA_ID=CAMNT_0043879873 /DNA_START=177 /DNA_END=1274 /DNA_ORIENTATION=+